MDPKLPGVFALGLVTVAGCGGEAATDSAGEPTTAGRDTGGFVGIPGTTGTTTGTTVGSEFRISATWVEGAAPCSDHVEIEVVDPLGIPEWNVGIAQTDPADGWLGEDCFTSACPVLARAAVLEQVDDCEDPGFDGASVFHGQTTAFGAEDEAGLTWVFEDGAFCFTFGHNPSYYASMGCQEL